MERFIRQRCHTPRVNSEKTPKLRLWIDKGQGQGRKVKDAGGYEIRPY